MLEAMALLLSGLVPAAVLLLILSLRKLCPYFIKRVICIHINTTNAIVHCGENDKKWLELYKQCKKCGIKKEIIFVYIDGLEQT